MLTHVPSKDEATLVYDHIAASCALFATRRVARVITRIYDAALAPAGLRGTQYNVLVAIARGRAESMTEMGRLLGMDRTTLTYALRVLTRENLVESAPDEDGRVRALRLTSLGRHRVAAAVPLWKAAQHKVEAALGTRRWIALNAELRELNRRLRTTLGDDGEDGTAEERIDAS